MSHQKKKPSGCGCSNIPISLIIFCLGGCYWWFSQNGIPDISCLAAKIARRSRLTVATPDRNHIPIPTPTLPSDPIVPSAQSTPSHNLPSSPIVSSSPAALPTITKPESNNQQATSNKKTNEDKPVKKTNWQKKAIRGIYLSRYQITNNASEQTIRKRIRYYHSQGINTIIHGVWGNACTMYNSEVMQQKLGYKSCPNKFRDRWLEWLIDEAHQQGMEVHAYFEKGIKIDKNSPVFDLAIKNKWLVPGVDRTYAEVEHYLLDVENPEVANFFRDILVEFVQKYPQIDAVQWDDYLGYHTELPGKIDRTESLTQFVQNAIAAMKAANPNVSFDICHHNPYWAKRYFAADWSQWNVDRVFIQAYNEKNFQDELNYVKKHDGIAITDQQFHRLTELIDNDAVDSILIFPLSGNPEATASNLKSLTK